MENNGEEMDDQGSGWFEVKKKHRSSSKFSLQSWVGGFSGKKSSNFICDQPSLNKTSANRKCKSYPAKVGENSSAKIQISTEYCIPLPNGDKEAIRYLDKCVVEQDGCANTRSLFDTDSHSESGNCDKNPRNDKPEIVQKMKWGDQEDGGLLNEYAVGAGIKFGNIGDVSLITSRKPEVNHDSLSCSGPNSDLDKVSHQLLLFAQDEIHEGSCQDVHKRSMEDIEVPVGYQTIVDPDNDASNCKDIHTEHDKLVNDDCLITNSSCGEEAKTVLKFREHMVLTELGDFEISEAPGENGYSKTEIIAHDSVLVSTEKSDPEISSKPNTGSLQEHEVPQGGAVQDVSNTNIVSALVEGETAVSKERFRQRLWCFLFENLNRAVDELYLLCELECDLEQMKEAILVLEEAASDFKELNARVEEFENVRRSSSQSIDGLPITLKSDHRRPHALSWEVRRMTTTPHRADILSSSLEAFKRIQEERASICGSTDSKMQGLQCLNLHVSNKIKSSAVSYEASSVKDSVESSKQSGSLDNTHGDLRGEERSIESARSGKVNLVRNGRIPPHNTSSSNVNLSKPPVAGKCKREKFESEVEKLLPKKDKMLTEGTGEKTQKYTDNSKYTSSSEKDKEKERRNTAPWKSMDAWKEKRNWVDILPSTRSRVSHSPGMHRKSAERARTLHDKLMSPEKKKKTSLDMKKEAAEKHARAMKIRNELENERVQKLQRTSEKLNRVNEWQAVRTTKLREGMYARQQRNESRHEAFLAQVVKRAGDESSKVNEVRFITSLNEENKKLMLRQKLHGSEMRRAEKLQVMKTKQKEDMAREEAVLERRKLIEAEKLQRLAETQRKKEEAQVRREEERKASSAAREARALEQLRRKEERAKAQQEESEHLAQKLAERLSESEQRRKFYLEQIKERASMDFRDQSSPLLRRYINKDVQGRSTPNNSSEDHQSSSSGLATRAMSNATLQPSMKRKIKRVRQRLMALKYEFLEASVGSENVGIGYRTAIGTAKAKIGRCLQELQRLRQARKEGAASIGLVIAEMIKYLDGKDLELEATRQAGLLDFIASALPASHTSKPKACQVMINLLKLLRVVLSAPANRSYFLAHNLLPPIIPMLSTALENYIKIAASVNAPGHMNFPSTKTSVENFESISELLDGFLWTVTTIIGHINSDEQQVQMWDALLELLIAYQVIHRLRDLFALYDRPQVEGSPFPSSILLSIHLLGVLTSRPGTNSSINWELLPIEAILENDRQKDEFADSVDLKISDVTESNGDHRPPLSVLNGVHISNVAADESCELNNNDESVSAGKDGEQEKTDCSVEEHGSNAVRVDILDKVLNIDDIPKPFVSHRDEEFSAVTVVEEKTENNMFTEQPVAFLLSSISDTGLVSLPSLLTAVLLQANNRLSSEQASYVLPSNFEEVATGVLKVLNHLALLDLKFMQRMLARPDLKMEFFHLMSFLLSHCTSKWEVATDQIGLLLLESLLLLAHFALFHPGNQAVLRWGKSPTILHKVCDLPFVFFSDPELMPVLASTLVAACYGCEQNKCVVQQELSMDMLLSLLRSCKNVSPPVRLNSSLDNSPADDSSECNQHGPEFKKPQVDSPLRPSRLIGKNSRLSLGKSCNLGNSIRIGRTRNLRDSKPIKTWEDTALKHNPQPGSDFASVMLHYRFPSSFIGRAGQFFSGGVPIVDEE